MRAFQCSTETKSTEDYCHYKYWRINFQHFGMQNRFLFLTFKYYKIISNPA